MRDPDKAFVRIKDDFERCIAYYGLFGAFYIIMLEKKPLNNKKATLQVAFNVVENIGFEIS